MPGSFEIEWQQALTNLQEKRITTAPGLHDRDAIAFHTSVENALDDVRQALR